MSLFHIMDSTIAPLMAIIFGGSALVLGDPDDAELRILVIPLIGAAIVAWATMLMNPDHETRSVTIGRIMFALFIGTLAPSFGAAVYPSVATFASKPVVLLLTGGTVSFVVFILSKPFTRRWYERAQETAVQLADAAEKHMVNVVRTAVATDAKVVAKELRDTVIPSDTQRAKQSKQIAKEVAAEVVSAVTPAVVDEFAAKVAEKTEELKHPNH